MTTHSKSPAPNGPTSYAVLIWNREDYWAGASGEVLERNDERHREFGRRAPAAGHVITSGAELDWARTASFARDGALVTDGPYAELAEVLGGLYVVTTSDPAGLTRLLADVFAGDPSLYEVRPIVPQPGDAG